MVGKRGAGGRPRLLLSFYRTEFINWPVVSELTSQFPTDVRTVRHRPLRDQGLRVITKRELILMELLFFFRYLISPRLYRSHWRFVCWGGHYGTLLFTRLLRLFGMRRRTYLLNFYLHEWGQNRVARKVLDVLLTPDVHVLAQTQAEVAYFRNFLPYGNVVHVPYCQGESPYVPVHASKPGDYVFAGGSANRDYDALLRCARALPQVPFVLVVSDSARLSERVSPNVTLRVNEPRAQFDRLLAESRFVVIPLKQDVGSSGQMVLLQAMSFGKTVLVPDVGAVRDYVEHEKTGIFYAAGNDASLRAQIAELWRAESLVHEIGGAARHAFVTSFTPAVYRRRVLDHVAGDRCGSPDG